MGCDLEHRMEGCFFKMGKVIAHHPWKMICFSIALVGIMGYGYTLLEDETRAEKQWVPEGSISLDHNEYVQKSWLVLEGEKEGEEVIGRGSGCLAITASVRCTNTTITSTNKKSAKPTISLGPQI